MAQLAIRTITVGVEQRHPIEGVALREAAGVARRLGARFAEAGYEVQTVRLATRPVFGQVPDLSAYATRLQRVMDEEGIGYLSLGPAQASRPGSDLDGLAGIADMLAGCEALSCTVQIGTGEHGVRAAAAVAAARVVGELSAATPKGVGNFRFAVLAEVGPGHPFFPAAYHEGPGTFSVGLQSAGVVAEALSGIPGEPDPAKITERVREALAEVVLPVVRLAGQLATEVGSPFAGIDLSPAPHGDTSIGRAIEHAIAGPFGAPGTLSTAAAITQALRSVQVPQVGYCGLMLPVMEDTTLARAWESGGIDPHRLLAYSAVCGTGLDTVPLPGDTPVEEVARLLMDVAALAVRLRKPLSARLFPVPGAGAGDRTDFGSPYLVDVRLPG
ncbi:DUF711 family protein [Nonomuraea sp. NPDC050394]|uniref:DUF711 family protein n=1 Tax=Nonomuraea sp. NPDC050394 TaxID=3364363 RepID=UPI0037ACF5C9